MPQLPFSFRDLAARQPDADAPDAPKSSATTTAPSAAGTKPSPPAVPARTTARAERPAPILAAAGEGRVYSVTEVQRTLRLRLEASLPSIAVRGEISNLRVQSSGHAYFTLKDRRAQLNCVFFSQERSRIRFRLNDGLAVVATGRITIYDRSGSLQLRVMSCEPVGEGALWAQFQERARLVRDEGLTAPDRKRPLPPHPQRVGVVTSRTGAALRDIVRTLRRRQPSVPIRLCHAQVQGGRATADLVAAIRCIDRFGDCDVLIVARGGGSIEDLWAFNELAVARTIAACSIPVIVGVGHETDLTIADMVADHAASTPTAAAAAAVADRTETVHRFEALHARLHRAVRQQIRHLNAELGAGRAALEGARPPVHRWAQHLDHLQHRAANAVRRRTNAQRARLRALEQRLEAAAPAVRLARARARLNRIPERLLAAVQAQLTGRQGEITALRLRLDPATARALAAHRAQLAEAAARLEALSPLSVLTRGYALVQSRDGAVVRAADALAPGETVEVRVAKGRFTATVVDVEAARDGG